MPALNFRVDFDKPNATFAPGEIVTGKVYFHLPQPKTIRVAAEIRLEVYGKAKVQWTELQQVKDKSDRVHHKTIYHTSKRHYVNKSIQLVGSKTGGQEFPLQAGLHTYPFQFRLPVDIPCSFEHTYGYVRYFAKVIYDRPWRIDDKDVTIFKVAAPYNFQGRSPIHDAIEREFHSWCCFSAGVMDIRIHSGTSRFFPGETIELTINVHNRSQVDVTDMHLELVKKMTFHASSMDRKYESQLLKAVHRSQPTGKEGEYLIKMAIPSISPSNMQYCSIIDVYHKLKLTIHVDGIKRASYDYVKIFNSKKVSVIIDE